MKIIQYAPPVELFPGDWHVPYFENGYWLCKGKSNVSLRDALDISMSCCAQVSYRVLDDSEEKAKKVVSRLNLGGDNNDPVHASPSEHQGTPMKPSLACVNTKSIIETWEDGITAYHKELGFMSGNFSGWIQNRQLIKNHTKW